MTTTSAFNNMFPSLAQNVPQQTEPVISRVSNCCDSWKATPDTRVQVGNYQIQSMLGEGGVATVYNATCRNQPQPVALKILNQHVAADKSVREGFKREFSVTRRLSHPNIVRSLDAGETNGRTYMTMELVQGETLEAYLYHNKSISEKGAIKIIAQIADALDYLHKQGIVHRDIKPSNIMLTHDNKAKLFDFGGALDRNNLEPESLDGLYGTVGYVSPEQAQVRPDIDGRADIYGLGIVLYRILAGRKPFYGTRHQVLRAHLEAMPPKPSKFSRVSPDLEAIILKCIAKEPAQRFQTGKELGDALRSVVLLPKPKPLGQRIKGWFGIGDGGVAAFIKRASTFSRRSTVESTTLSI